MRLNTLALVVGATIILASPVAAHAAERVPAPVSETEEIFGSPVFAIILVAALLGLLVWQLSDSDEDVPTSP